MDRRAFLKTTGVLLGAAGSGGLVAACGQQAGIPSGQPTLNVIDASFETLIGTPRRYAFGLTTAVENVPVVDPDLRVYTRDPDERVTGGPYEVRHVEEGPLGIGVYLAELSLPEPGIVEVVAVSGDDHGMSAIQVIRPEDSVVAVPGAPAVDTPTPTVDEPLGLAELCTRDPDCGMHETSLDQALAAGRPVALLFATPRYCQTAVCGPSVDVLDELRGERDWGDMTFIHCEIFSDEGTTVAEPVRAWGLPTEPWFFTIASDGAVSDRVDGVMVGDVLREMLERLA